MAVTAATLITEVRYELKDDNASDYNFPTTELIVYIADAVEYLTARIAAVHPDYWLRTGQTQSSTGTSVPSDCYKIVAVISGGKILNELDYARSLDSNAAGYHVLNDTVVVQPSGTPTLKYISRPTRVSDENENVPLADDFRQLIKTYVVMKAKARQTENAQAFGELFAGMREQFDKMILETNRERQMGWAPSTGTATVADYMTEIRFELGDTNASDIKFEDGELLSYLNDAISDLVQRIAVHSPRYWFATGQTYVDVQNIVADQQTYNLPSDLYRLIDVVLVDSDGDKAVQDWIEFNRTFDTEADGFHIFNRDVYLYGTPDTAVTNGLELYYIPRPTRLTASTDTVPLDSDFRALTKKHVVITAKAREAKNPATYIALYKKLEGQLAAMMGRTNLGTYHSMKTPTRQFI